MALPQDTTPINKPSEVLSVSEEQAHRPGPEPVPLGAELPVQHAVDNGTASGGRALESALPVGGSDTASLDMPHIPEVSPSSPALDSTVLSRLPHSDSQQPDVLPARKLQSSKVPASRIGRLFHYGGMSSLIIFVSQTLCCSQVSLRRWDTVRHRSYCDAQDSRPKTSPPRS